MIDAIVSFAQNNPLLVFAVLFFIYKQWQSRQPWPDYGGTITSISSLAEWKTCLADAEKAGKIVCVDCYATWCPPCKAAAPVFAAMSDKIEGCVFAKVNVDNASDVAKELAIKAMPTFKIFKSGEEVDAMQGFAGETKLRSLIDKHVKTK